MRLHKGPDKSWAYNGGVKRLGRMWVRRNFKAWYHGKNQQWKNISWQRSLQRKQLFQSSSMREQYLIPNKYGEKVEISVQNSKIISQGKTPVAIERQTPVVYGIKELEREVNLKENQGSVLSLLVFVNIMESLTSETREGLPGSGSMWMIC